MATDAGPRRFDWKGFLILCGIYVAVALLWETEAVLPLKLLVVLLHEASHGIAAVLTGGRVVEMQVGLDQGGHCVTDGGIEFVVISAGYLGSLVAGVTLLLVATRTRFAPHVAALLGALLAILAFRFMPHWGFGRGFALFAGLVLAALALFPPAVASHALRVIGVTSCLYVFLDIKHDVLDRDHPASDASRLAEITRPSAFLWGILWMGISLVAIGLAAKWAVTGPAPASAAPKPPKSAAPKPKARSAR